MDTTEQFSLRWNMFHSNLTTSIHELFDAADLVDVTLAVDGHLLQAHKIVLSICSNYFKEIFKANPCKHPVVILNDVVYENMKDILQFMYNGQVNVLKENLSSFLRTAELLQVKGLTGDDSSETSSKRDERLDNVGDNEDDSDLMNYNHLMDSDVEIPQQYPSAQSISTPLQQQYSSAPRAPTPPKLTPVNSSYSKRPSKIQSGSTNSKRSKSEVSVNHNGKGGNKQTNDQENGNVSRKVEECDFIETPELNDEKFKMEKISMELEEPKDVTNSVDISKDNFVGNSSGEVPNDNGKSEAKYTRHNYQCSSCSKKFSRRDHLRTHEKNIHGEDAGPFACMFCSQMYKNTESLRKHIAKFHFPKLTEYCEKAEVQV